MMRALHIAHFAVSVPIQSANWVKKAHASPKILKQMRWVHCTCCIWRRHRRPAWWVLVKRRNEAIVPAYQVTIEKHASIAVKEVRYGVLRRTTKKDIRCFLDPARFLPPVQPMQCVKHETERSHRAYRCRRPRSLSLRTIGPEVALQMVAWAASWSPSSTCDWKAFWSCCWSNALNWRAEARLSSIFAFLAVRSDFLASAAAISVLFEYISLLCSSCSVDFSCSSYRNHPLIRSRCKIHNISRTVIRSYINAQRHKQCKNNNNNNVGVSAWWDLDQWLFIRWLRSVDLELCVPFGIVPRCCAQLLHCKPNKMDPIKNFLGQQTLICKNSSSFKYILMLFGQAVF